MKDYINVCDVEKYYGSAAGMTKAVDRVSFQVEEGEFVGVMGQSGSGKTTLLNCVATIDRPTSGSIVIDGRELTRLRGKELAKFRRERLGFIFQDCNLLDTLTAGENIAYGQRTPAAVMDAWMNSSGHRANILNSSYTHIGVGYCERGNYWTQMFMS